MVCKLVIIKGLLSLFTYAVTSVPIVLHRGGTFLICFVIKYRRQKYYGMRGRVLTFTYICLKLPEIAYNYLHF